MWGKELSPPKPWKVINKAKCNELVLEGLLGMEFDENQYYFTSDTKQMFKFENGQLLELKFK